mmetsp:Transcript_25612/g.41033  ORF Transcript_25612/g.41033 Transcript_25612/m.41033 type:complete len:421 (+) Transcript_25612:3-1265(+)
MSVQIGAASMSLTPEEEAQSYRSLQPELLFAGVSLGTDKPRLAATGASDPKVFHRFGLKRACQLDAAFQLGSSLPGSENVISPVVNTVSGEVASPDCGFRMHFQTALVDTLQLSQKVIHYSIWANLLSIWQIRCFLGQMRHASDGPAAAKVSMACIAMLALMDAYDSFLHVCLGLSAQFMFNTVAVCALFKFLLFSFLEARYMLIILRHRRHDIFAEGWEAIRREVSWLYTRFYGALFLGLMLIYNNLNHLDLIVLALQGYWIPQILWDAWNGHRGSLKPSFITGISLSRTLLLLYAWGCPHTIFSGELYPRLPNAPNTKFCLLLAGIQVAQVTTLLLQQRWGPRWFVPWVCMPWAYNYHRFEIVDPGTDCVICMVELDPEDGKRVVTPCQHKFHQECLQQWMDVKMECPTCRTALPPIQ